jgi:hypothetical protein
MHSPSTRSVSAISGNEQPLPMLYCYIMCFPTFMLFQADSTCNIYQRLFVHYSTACSKYDCHQRHHRLYHQMNFYKHQATQTLEWWFFRMW